MSKVVGIIPARWGSTRFPGKPLHPIAGKPLLRHVWERCRRARSLDTVIIATDDMRIAEAAFGWGAEVALTSAKHRSGTDRIAEVARQSEGLRLHHQYPGRRTIDRSPPDQSAGARAKKRSPSRDDHRSASVRRSERGCFASSGEGRARPTERRALFFARASRQAGKYFRHQGIYGYRRASLASLRKVETVRRLERAESLEQLRALENGVRIRVVVTASGSPGVDTPEDAEAIERQLRSARRRSARKKRSSKR